MLIIKNKKKFVQTFDWYCIGYFNTWGLTWNKWARQSGWAEASPLLSLGRGWMWGTDRGKNSTSDGEQGDGGGELSGRSRGMLSKQSLWVMGGRKCGRRSLCICPAPLHKNSAPLSRPLEMFRCGFVVCFLLPSVISKLFIHWLMSRFISMFTCLFLFLITLDACSRQISSNEYSSLSVLIPVSVRFSRLPWCQRWTPTIGSCLFMHSSSFWGFACKILGSDLSWMHLSLLKVEFRGDLSVKGSDRSTAWPDVFKTERRRRWGGKLAVRPTVRKSGAGRRSTVWHLSSLVMIPNPADLSWVLSMLETGGGTEEINATKPRSLRINTDFTSV